VVKTIKKKTGIRQTRGDILFDIINYSWLSVFGLFVLYPLYVVIISSISDPIEVALGSVVFVPVGFTLEGYTAVLRDSRVFIGFYNSIIYTCAGTVLNVTCTAMAGYSLSRKDLFGGTAIMLFFIFTMYFQGGLIPTFVLVRNLGLYGTRTIMIIMDLVWVYLIIIARTFYKSTIPQELLEAARIDGCDDFHFFIKIVVPLSGSLTAVLTLFYGVAHWNNYFRALIYLKDGALWPLQLVLRRILLLQEFIANEAQDGVGTQEFFNRAELVKYALIVIASIPMLTLYPFVQKHFVQGVMIGSIKG
jgi:ABC-type glycerol-3-phosphate transport system permease component